MKQTTEQLEAAIGQQIKKLRVAAGLSQAALADAASLSVATVQNLERGAGGTVATLVKLCKALGQEPWLLTLAPEMGPTPLELLRASKGKAPRQRAYKARASKK